MTTIPKFKKFFNFSKAVVRHLLNFPCGPFAAQAAFFISISFFPFAMLMLSFIKYLPVDFQSIENLILQYTMPAVHSTVHSIYTELILKTNQPVVWISVIVYFWSSSTGFMALLSGLNAAYCSEDNRSYWKVRALAIVYTITFMIILTATLVLLVFGTKITNLLLSKLPSFVNYAPIQSFFRYFVMGIILTVYFALIYTVAPQRKLNFLSQLPGAIVSSLGWILFSLGYSIYVEYALQSSPVYGSLSSIIFLMLWLYFCMFIFFVGATVNKVFMISKKIERIKQKREA